jgi:hypothetical protein
VRRAQRVDPGAVRGGTVISPRCAAPSIASRVACEVMSTMRSPCCGTKASRKTSAAISRSAASATPEITKPA